MTILVLVLIGTVAWFVSWWLDTRMDYVAADYCWLMSVACILLAAFASVVVVAGRLL